jgi:lipoprotein-anchoring transpeptidase ErfK/SrfK
MYALKHKPAATQAQTPVQTPPVPTPITEAVQSARTEEVKPAVVPETTAKDSSQAAELIAKGLESMVSNPPRILEARKKLNEALWLPLSGEQQKLVKEQLSALADKWLFSRTIITDDPLCGTYLVKPGDNLITIGAKYQVPPEILMQINNISRPEALAADSTIKVINGPFHAKVRRSTFTLDLYLQNTFVKTYRVGLGKPGNETPTGIWMAKVGGKLISPDWVDPDTQKKYTASDPDYPLGSRWIALDGIEGNAKGRTGFAIHGTKKPEEIGVAASRGCIRMYNGDVITIYNMLMPGYSRVVVEE